MLYILLSGVVSLRTMSSAAVGAISSTRDVTLNPQMEEEELKNNKNNEVEGETGQLPHGDDDQGDDELEEEDDAELKFGKEFDLGPQFSLKEQLEKDKVRFFFILFCKVGLNKTWIVS